jgi:hypothetical protein
VTQVEDHYSVLRTGWAVLEADLTTAVVPWTARDFAYESVAA